MPGYLWPIAGCERRRDSGAQTGQSRWQWSPSNREAAGTPAGFGEAVHCWTSTKRWSHCWIRSLSIKVGYFLCFIGMLCDNLLFSCGRTLILDFSYYGILKKIMLCWMFQVSADDSNLLPFNIIISSLSNHLTLILISLLHSSI